MPWTVSQHFLTRVLKCSARLLYTSSSSTILLITSDYFWLLLITSDSEEFGISDLDWSYPFLHSLETLRVGIRYRANLIDTVGNSRCKSPFPGSRIKLLGQHAVEKCQSCIKHRLVICSLPPHPVAFEPFADYQLASAFNQAAANRIASGSVFVVTHAITVVVKVVDMLLSFISIANMLSALGSHLMNSTEFGK